MLIRFLNDDRQFRLRFFPVPGPRSPPYRTAWTMKSKVPPDTEPMA
jgi:hypothetical protein